MGKFIICGVYDVLQAPEEKARGITISASHGEPTTCVPGLTGGGGSGEGGGGGVGGRGCRSVRAGDVQHR
jgi:hypothetical protein